MRVNREAAIEPIAEEWEALATRTNGSVFDGPGWLGAWWRAFGSGGLEVVAVRDGDELVGVLPLVRRAGGIRSPTNWHTPSFGPTGTPEGIAAACDALFASPSPYVLLRFLEAPDAVAAAARRRGYQVHVRELQRSPYAQLDRIEPGQPTSTAKSRGRARRLASLGEVELDVRDGTAGLDDDLRLAFELEGSGWKREAGTAIVSRPETRRFYEDVARWAAPRGLLRLLFLRVGGRAVAVELVLADGGRTFDVKGGYDPSYRTYAPGRVLRDLMLDWAKREGFRTHEFLGDSEPWKLERAHGVRTRYELVAVRGRVRGWAVRTAFVHGRPLARRARGAVDRLAGAGGRRSRRSGDRARGG